MLPAQSGVIEVEEFYNFLDLSKRLIQKQENAVQVNVLTRRTAPHTLCLFWARANCGAQQAPSPCQFQRITRSTVMRMGLVWSLACRVLWWGQHSCDADAHVAWRTVFLNSLSHTHMHTHTHTHTRARAFSFCRSATLCGAGGGGPAQPHSAVRGHHTGRQRQARRRHPHPPGTHAVLATVAMAVASGLVAVVAVGAAVAVSVLLPSSPSGSLCS